MPERKSRNTIMFVTIVMSGENKKKVYVKVIGNHLQFAMLELQQKKKKS